jgi:hypothetical protein
MFKVSNGDCTAALALHTEIASAMRKVKPTVLKPASEPRG